jgi:hypothetical protein
MKETNKQTGNVEPGTSRKGKIITTVIVYTVIMGLATLVSMITSGEDYGCRVITDTIANGLSLISILSLATTPMISVITLFISEWARVIGELLIGKGFGEAVNSLGTIEIYSWFVALFILVKEVKNTKSIKKAIISKRQPYKVPIWAIATVVFMTMTVVFNTTSSELIVQASGSKVEQLYGSLAVVIPSITILARYTASNLAYVFLVIQSLLQTVTMIYKGDINLVAIMFIATVIISLIRYILIVKNKRSDNGKDRYKRNKDSEHTGDHSDDSSSDNNNSVTSVCNI